MMNHMAKNTRPENVGPWHGTIGRHSHYREHVIVTDRRECTASCCYIRIQQSQQLGFRF